MDIAEICKEIELKRQELNLLMHNTSNYHFDAVLEKSQEVDKLIEEFHKTLKRKHKEFCE